MPKLLIDPNVCPRCGSADIDNYGTVCWIDDNTLEQDCSCWNCDCDFTVRYKATPIEIKIHE